MCNQPYKVKDSIQEFIEELKAYDSISLDEIPEYRLFISQVEEFFDKKLGKNADDDEEKKVISKTMIQNYIKDGLIMPPEGKSYNRNHVILLAIIYNLKSILTIRDIKKLLTPILEKVDVDNNEDSIEHIYNTFFSLKESFLDGFSKDLDKDIDLINQKLENWGYGECQKIHKILLVLTLVTQANIRKRLAEHIIDLYFTDEEDPKE